MTTVHARTASPKQLFRLAERTYGRLQAATEGGLLSEAVRATEALLREMGTHARGTVAPLDELPSPPGLPRLLADRVLVEHEPVPAVAWLLHGRQDWVARFELPGPPSEEVALFLEIAREAVQLRLSEHAWNGVVDRVQAIQQSLLPNPIPQVAGFRVAARSVPAESVGGDVYDVQSAGDGRLVLALADASGHGLPAALEARDVVVGIRMALLCGARLTGIVSRLNDVLLGTTLSSRFVSLVLAELDTDGRFAWVNAGHPAPMLVGDGPPRFLEGAGRVLGITRSYPYRIREVRLPPGSAVVITTDGAGECLSPTDEELGSERLLRLAGSLCRETAAGIVEGLFEGLSRHARGRAFQDDVSALVVKRGDRHRPGTAG
jgi:sigma-B regulation protein RsbU (phosphoserine phosphatase)